jgi:class 3 adenylate cyclase
VADRNIVRKLRTIVALDAAGYSRLMGQDEEGTHAALQSHIREVVLPAIAAHRGRSVKTTGDGLLAEFASVVEAVQCCLDIQGAMAERNEPVPAARRIEFRIGVNIGDVIIDGDDIFGDGVNIAARLEGIADPGGICLSAAAREQVRNTISVGFQDLGDLALRNIEAPKPHRPSQFEVRDFSPHAHVVELAFADLEEGGNLLLGHLFQAAARRPRGHQQTRPLLDF